MNAEHTKAVIAAVAIAVSHAMKDVLAQRISEHYSEQDWDDIVAQAVRQTEYFLGHSHELEQALLFSDLHRADGSLNMEGYIDALASLVERTQRPDHRAQIQHLLHHTRHTYEGMKRAFGR